MTYANRAHVHNREVKLRLNSIYHDKLKRVAESTGAQPSVLVRLCMEALLEKVDREGIAPLEDLLSQEVRQG